MINLRLLSFKVKHGTHEDTDILTMRRVIGMLEIRERQFKEAMSLLRQLDPLEHCATGCLSCGALTMSIKEFIKDNEGEL